MKCNVLIDWLTFTVKTATDPMQVIKDYLQMDPCLFHDEYYGLMGYDNVKSHNGIVVAYNPRENQYFHGMGICISMSGSGCRTFEHSSGLKGEGSVNTAFPLLFERLHIDPEVNISRVDLACDDHEGFLNMADIVEKVNVNEINSRIQKRSVITSFNGRQATGTSVYLGSEQSDFRVRIYDKAAEQMEFDRHWIRVELVMRGDHANAFVDNFVNAEAVGHLAAQIINDKFRFIENDDNNISRCSTSGWWLEFVDTLESVQLVVAELTKHKVEEIEEWVTRQLAPTLGLLFKAKGFFAINEILKDGVDRMTNRHQSILDDYNMSRRYTTQQGREVFCD